MSLKIKVNFQKGWPCPSIVDFVSTNTPAATAIDEGQIVTRNSAGQFVLGVITDPKAHIYVVWNGGARDGDHNHAFPSTATASLSSSAQVAYGGIQGIWLGNQFEVETAQFTGTPAFGDNLGVTAAGLLRVAATGDVIVGQVTKGAHTKPGGVSMITFLPDTSKRISA